jgi:hypothetical protein
MLVVEAPPNRPNPVPVLGELPAGTAATPVVEGCPNRPPVVLVFEGITLPNMLLPVVSFPVVPTLFPACGLVAAVVVNRGVARDFPAAGLLPTADSGWKEETTFSGVDRVGRDPKGAELVVS